MNLPEKRINNFIDRHHVLSLATFDENSVWCCNCFYIYLPETVQFLITSDENTKHIEQAIAKPLIAGSIVLETKIIGKIQGIQFTGTIQKVEKSEYKKYNILYLKRFPYAILKSSSLWLINLTQIKMTDNRLGFGKKLFWQS